MIGVVEENEIHPKVPLARKKSLGKSRVHDIGENDRNMVKVSLNSTPVCEKQQHKQTPANDGNHKRNISIANPRSSQQGDAGERLKCCKIFITFLFSNIGLCLAVIAYVIMGGFVFRELEAPKELHERRYVAKRRAELATELWRRVGNNSKITSSEKNFSRDTELILIAYQEVVLEAKKAGWEGADNNVDIPPQWSYAGAVLYSVTVITTIGYGNLAPKTANGQLVTLFYALFGIPLNFLWLTNMGRFLGKCFRLLYVHICKLCTRLCCKPRVKPSTPINGVPKSKQLLKSDPRNNKIAPENNPNPQTCAMSTNTSGKNKVLRKQRSQSMDAIPTKVEKHVVFRVASEASIKFNNTGERLIDEKILIDPNAKPHSQPVTEADTEKVRVPILVSLVVIAVYVFGGALMFSEWENWSYLEGSYYCFITLSTIGFGDYVPGSITNTKSADSTEKLVICCIYLMFGLSIIAMCFDLMQEEVRIKFKWLGRKIGLIDKH